MTQKMSSSRNKREDVATNSTPAFTLLRIPHGIILFLLENNSAYVIFSAFILEMGRKNSTSLRQSTTLIIISDLSSVGHILI